MNSGDPTKLRGTHHTPVDPIEPGGKHNEPQSNLTERTMAGEPRSGCWQQRKQKNPITSTRQEAIIESSAQVAGACTSSKQKVNAPIYLSAVWSKIYLG